MNWWEERDYREACDREFFWEAALGDANDMNMVCHWWDHEWIIQKAYVKLTHLVWIIKCLNFTTDRMVIGLIANMALDEKCQK